MGFTGYDLLLYLGNWSRVKNSLLMIWNLTLSDWQELCADLEILANNFLSVLRIQGFGWSLSPALFLLHMVFMGFHYLPARLKCFVGTLDVWDVGCMNALESKFLVDAWKNKIPACFSRNLDLIFQVDTWKVIWDSNFVFCCMLLDILYSFMYLLKVQMDQFLISMSSLISP